MTHQTTKSDCGHGHVYPRADGVRARCGGPAICSLCAMDMAAKMVNAAYQLSLNFEETKHESDNRPK